MAVAATAVAGASTVFGNKRVRVYDLAFSGSYSTGGESVTAEDVGLKKIEQAIPHGNASETDETGAWITNVDYQTDGASVKVVLFEGAGAGIVPTQKPAEAYESAGRLRVAFIGY
jgi:hypothetical protein